MDTPDKIPSNESEIGEKSLTSISPSARNGIDFQMFGCLLAIPESDSSCQRRSKQRDSGDDCNTNSAQRHEEKADYEAPAIASISDSGREYKEANARHDVEDIYPGTCRYHHHDRGSLIQQRRDLFQRPDVIGPPAAIAGVLG